MPLNLCDYLLLAPHTKFTKHRIISNKSGGIKHASICKCLNCLLVFHFLTVFSFTSPVQNQSLSQLANTNMWMKFSKLD